MHEGQKSSTTLEKAEIYATITIMKRTKQRIR